jgi:Leucine-rich repeat (LRR) protein
MGRYIYITACSDWSKSIFDHVTQPDRNLGGLAFLDLAQNHIQEVRRADLTGLTSLTALNLERNVIQQLDEDTFAEVNRSLSSVSLLNNLLTKYPEGALTSLKDLRVSAAIDRFLHLPLCQRILGLDVAFDI